MNMAEQITSFLAYLAVMSMCVYTNVYEHGRKDYKFPCEPGYHCCGCWVGSRGGPIRSVTIKLYAFICTCIWNDGENQRVHNRMLLDIYRSASEMHIDHGQTDYKFPECKDRKDHKDHKDPLPHTQIQDRKVRKETCDPRPKSRIARFQENL